MINNYMRPNTLEEALKLLAQPDTIPLGGGTFINTPDFASTRDGSVSAVDLQALGLGEILPKGRNLEIGATTTLQQMLDCEYAPQALKAAIRLETAINIRNAATAAGRLVACDGRSSYAVTMLALDAKLTTAVDQGENTISLGDFLPLRPPTLITKITIPGNVKTAFEYVARTPADRPIVCVSVAQWPSGRTRVAVGGFGAAPSLAMDGTESDGFETAARNAFHEASDQWASAEYRIDVANTLAKRCMENLS